ncbi:MAG: hypothetical protein JW748_15635 [Anaerolineales bacterium]|nr:hypothetical protein [Anaerolineales bacterium]
MVKSSAIVGVVTFFLVLISGLLYNICCLVSPLLAVVLGLAAGFLCSVFEKPVDAEKAAVRGGIAGAITGAVALIAETIGATIAQYIGYQGGNVQACLPGLCEEGAAPVAMTNAMLGAVFNSCFCGLILLAVMAGLGAAGAVVWMKTSAKKKTGPAAGSPGAPTAG